MKTVHGFATRLSFVLSASAIALAAATSGASATVVARGNCATTATAYKAATGVQTTDSSTAVTVRDIAINFTSGRTSCVIVMFSAEAFANAGTSMDVTVRLDDSTVCQPGSNNRFVRSGTETIMEADRAMNFICQDVAAGTHAVRVKFASNPDGNLVGLNYRTLLVHYAK